MGESLNTITRLPFARPSAKKGQARFHEAVGEMNGLVDRLIPERRANPNPAASDLLNLMLTAVDPATGERLDDLNIRYQVLTFLIAGHETTSGMLTFAFSYLLRNPAI